MMNYISKNETMKYWRINLIPINNKGYGTAHAPIFKGKTLENAIKSARKHCEKFKMQEDPKSEMFQVYGVDEQNPILYECDYWGRKVIK